MACELCEKIADVIMCQGCAKSIIASCEYGECEADDIMTVGSVNGHSVRGLRQAATVERAK